MALIDDFNRANGAPANGWTDRNGSFPSLAAIVSNKLQFPAGAANASRRAILLQKTSPQQFATQKVVVYFTVATQATQLPCAWIKVNEAGDKGIRAYVSNTTTGLVIQKISDMDGATAFSTLSNTAITLTNGNVYRLEVDNVGAAYEARLYNSGGTLILTVNATDAEGDSADFTGAHPAGLSAQTATDFDDFQVLDPSAGSYSVSFAGEHNAPTILKGADVTFRNVMTVSRNGGHTASVSITNIANLPSGVTSPADSDPGATNNGWLDLLASGSATEDLTGTTITVTFTDGVDTYDATFTLRVANNELAVDDTQAEMGGSSSVFYSIQWGGLGALLATLHGGVNSKDATLATNGTFNGAHLGGTTAMHNKGAAEGYAVQHLNFCNRYKVKTIYAIPWCTSDSPSAWSTIKAAFIAGLQYLLGHGINVVFMPNFVRFDTATENVGGGGANLSSVSGNITFGITGYTFSGSDVGRWLLVRRDATHFASRKIVSVNTGANTCTIENAFTSFTATTSMNARVYSGGKMAAIEEYNTEVPKLATDSGHADAQQNLTMGSKVYYYSSINGVDVQILAQEYVDSTDLNHRGPTTTDDPGHVMTATKFRDLIAFHILLTGATVDLSPATATIAPLATQQLTASETGFAAQGWTGGYPGNMTAHTFSKQSGVGSVNGSGLYTADGGEGSAVIRAALTYAVTKYDESTITIAEGGEVIVSAAGPSCLRRTRRYPDKYPRRPNIRASRACKDYTN